MYCVELITPYALAAQLGQDIAISISLAELVFFSFFLGFSRMRSTCYGGGMVCDSVAGGLGMRMRAGFMRQGNPLYDFAE